MWLIPSLTGLIVFFFVPVAAVIIFAFHSWHLGEEPQWAGLDTFAAVLGSRTWWHAVGLTITLCAIIVPLELAGGLGIAKLLTRSRGSRLLQAALLVPWAMAPLTVGVLARWISSPSSGVISQVIGRRFDIASEPVAAMLFAASVVIWQTTGFVALLYTAALRGMSPELRAAAALDGAGAWRMLVSIELPLLRRLTLFVSVAGIAGVFAVYDVLVPLTGGGTGTTPVSMLIVQTAWQEFDIGSAAAMSVLATIVMAAVMLVPTMVLRRSR